jgi:uncharacterized membrane protein YraQ (UPF0718 family)
MGFWKATLSRIISGISIAVILALILPHLDFFKMWFANRGWAIAIGLVIGTIISLNLSKICNFFKWLFIRIYKIICGICRWISAKCKWLFGKLQNFITTISGSSKKNAKLEEEIKEVNERITKSETGFK